jgi:hypothetical protein
LSRTVGHKVRTAAALGSPELAALGFSSGGLGSGGLGSGAGVRTGSAAVAGGGDCGRKSESCNGAACCGFSTSGMDLEE